MKHSRLAASCIDGFDTMPTMFWHGVHDARRHRWPCARRISASGRPAPGREFGAQRARDRHGADRARLRAGRLRLRSSPTPTANGCSADLGILGAGGVSNGIYPTDAPAQVEYLRDDSRTSSCSSRTTSSSTRRWRCASALPLLRKIIVFDMEGLRDFDDPQVISLDALRALGRDTTRAHPERLGASASTPPQAERPRDPDLHLGHHRQAQGRDALAPQPDLQRRRGYNTMACAATRPTSACASCRCATSPSASAATTIRRCHRHVVNFVENPETVPENVREIAPTVFTAVPRIWEKFYSGVMIALKEATAARHGSPTHAAIGIGTRSRDYVMAGKPVPAAAAAAAFRSRAGSRSTTSARLIGMHRARFLVTGAAPISPDLVRWYLALGRRRWSRSGA